MPARLGDDIDDFCVKCKRIMNHAVVSVLNGEPAKVRCRTCHSDHDFRHEQAPPPKVDPRKAALFNEVLKKVNPEAAPVALDGDPADLVDAVDPVDPVDSADMAETEGPAELEPPAEKVAPPAKAKVKGRGKK